MNTSEQINEIVAAMVKVQAMMKPAVKDAVNPHFRSRYADLASVWDACRGPLTANGITVWQDVATRGISTSGDDFITLGVGVVTRLSHVSGQWVEFGPLVVPLTKADAHGVGSATSYGKRYALAAAVGIVSDDDDDGTAAVRQPTQGAQQMPPEPPTAPAYRPQVSAAVTVEPHPPILYGGEFETPFDGEPTPYVTSSGNPRQSPPERKAQESGNGAMLRVSDAQSKRLYARAKAAGWEDADLKAYLRSKWNVESSKQIYRRNYDAVVAAVDKGPGESWP